jgi:hypothetical protein
MANYAQRRDALIRIAAEAGEMVGRQKMADLMALALNDPAVMGKDVLGPERIKRVYVKIHELEAELAQAWRKGDEQDYQQERLDRELRRIFGGEFVPFSERYPDVKKPK